MLAILTTHPIQYQVPIWQRLAARRNVPFKVYFMSDQGLARRFDPQFGQDLAWDIDLLSGYDHAFLKAEIGSRQSSFFWLQIPNDTIAGMRAEGASVLWVQGWQVRAYWQAVHQARRAGLPLWLRAETNLRSNGGGWQQIVKRPLLNRYLKSFDKLLCIGEANRQFYLARGLAPDRLASAPYCVDNERFAASAEDLRSQRDDIRAAYNIPKDAFCILFVGKLIDKKRPRELAQAAALLSQRWPERKLHLLFVGTGALLDELRQLGPVAYDFEPTPTPARAPQAGVPASFAGFLNQSQIARAYVAADSLVLPSEATETWGLVVNEAMASGLPAIVSEACGCADDLVKPERPDLCFPLDDIEAMSKAIENAIRRPQTAADVRRIVARCDVLRTVETVEALYARSAAERGSRAA